MEAVTLVIAVVGLALAIVSLVWQIVAWRYEGPKIKVTTARGVRISGGQGPGAPHVFVQAANVGRSPIEVTGWGFDLGNDVTTYTSPDVPGSTPVPSTIDGGHGAMWLIAVDALRDAVADANTGERPRAFVNLATGGKSYSKPVELADQ